MSNDLSTQLSEYGSQTREAREPVSATDVANRVDQVQVIAAVRAPNGRRGWHVAVAAAAGTLLIVGGVAWLAQFGGGAPSADESTVTSISDEFTTPETTVPEEISELVGPVVVDDASAFDEVLDDERMASEPTISIGPDGLPVIWYWSEDPEVFFGDGIGSSGMRIVRCADATCGAYEVIDARSDVFALPPAVFLPDGAPVFVESGRFPGATEGTGMVNGLAELHVCTDALCSEVETTVLETVDYPDLILNVPRVVVGENGLPVLYFLSDAPPAVNTVKVMTCDDRACRSGTVRKLFENAAGFEWIDAGDAVAIDRTGRALLVYHESVSGQIMLDVCTDAACSDVTRSVVIGEDIGDFWAPRVMIDPDGVPVIWFTRGEPGTSEYTHYVARCLDTDCTEVRELEATYRMPATEEAFALEADGALVVVWATPSHTDDGESIPAYLKVTRCTDLACATSTTVQAASLISDENLALGRWTHGTGPSVMIGDDGLPLIAYGTIDGLHLIRCPDAACTPPEG